MLSIDSALLVCFIIRVSFLFLRFSGKQVVHFGVLDSGSHGVITRSKIITFIVDEELKQKADIEITGEAFSVLGLRKGNLISCKARIEVKAHDPQVAPDRSANERRERLLT